MKIKHMSGSQKEPYCKVVPFLFKRTVWKWKSWWLKSALPSNLLCNATPT